MSYHQARWCVEVLLTRAHSADPVARVTARSLIKRTCRALHAERYDHGTSQVPFSAR